MWKVLAPLNPVSPSAAGGVLSMDIAIARKDGVEGLLVNGQFIPKGGSVVRYERVVGDWDERTCEKCWPYYGKRYRVDDPNKPVFPLHRRGRHWLEPVIDFLEPEGPPSGATVTPDVPLGELGAEAMKNAYGTYRAGLLQDGVVKVADLYDDAGTLIPAKNLKAKFVEQVGAEEIGTAPRVLERLRNKELFDRNIMAARNQETMKTLYGNKRGQMIIDGLVKPSDLYDTNGNYKQIQNIKINSVIKRAQNLSDDVNFGPISYEKVEPIVDGMEKVFSEFPLTKPLKSLEVIYPEVGGGTSRLNRNDGQHRTTHRRSNRHIQTPYRRPKSWRVFPRPLH